MPEDVGRTGQRELSARKRRPPLISRDQVIDTAYRLVEEHGPSGLSMRRLAGALHVSLPTVYTAIDNREALVERLLDRLVDEIADGMALAGTGPDAPLGSGEEQLQRHGRALLDWASHRPNLTAFLLEEEIGPRVAEQAVRTAGAPRCAATRGLLQAIVGSDAGSIDPVVALMMVVAEGRAVLWLARQERLATVGSERWVELGCRNVARALQTLAEATVASRR